MLRNYIIIAFRNLINNKSYAVINLSGLAIGITCSFLILLWVHDELSYDGFHQNGDRIYRVVQNIHFSDHDARWSITQGPLGPSLKQDFPEITDACRITWRRFNFSHKENTYDEIVGLADPSLFSMFTFPLVSGNKSNILNDPRSIILSEEMAHKYFKNENALGKTIKADNKFEFLVTGIMKNIPSNSQLQFNFIIPFIFGREINWTVDQWNNSRFYTYIIIQEGISEKLIADKIRDYLKEKPTLEENADLNLQPLKEIHLYSDYDFDFPHGDIKNVIIFSSIAIIILLIACFNFISLTTARSANRAKEIGMRKVSGAGKKNIVIQFLIESLMYTIFALLAALLLVDFLMPAFNQLSGKTMQFSIAQETTVFILVPLVLITAMISGTYPALLLSSFKPVTILKGKNIFLAGSGNSRRRSLFQQILVVAQFSLLIILIIGSIIIYNQINFMKDMKLGFDKNNIIHASMSRDMRQNYVSLKNELLTNPSIQAVTATSNILTDGYEFSNSLWGWEGKTEDQEILFRNVYVDEDYFNTFKMEIIDGRVFSKAHPSDTTAVIINQAAMYAMQMDYPVGKQLRYTRGEYVADIIGVVKNYNFRSLHNRIEPLVILFAPDQCQNICIRVNSANLSATLGYIQQVWSRIDSGHPFEYHFLDGSLNELYQSEDRFNSLVRSFTLLSFFISMLGIFGLASFLARQRIKEIGIRKVLGASVFGIVRLFSSKFVTRILLSNLIAWPVAWYASKIWLENFAYKTPIHWWIFMLAGVISIGIALVTISFHAIKAGLTNPVESLKYE